MGSACCGAPLIDPWGTWEGLCSECKEYSFNEDEENSDPWADAYDIRRDDQLTEGA